MTKSEVVFVAYGLRRAFWRCLFKAFQAFEDWQERWPKWLIYRTRWEGRLFLWLGTRGG
ncbi:MAG: hypothetical protein HY927_06160 [Elusimicrobia bacterium]|nr:hypothetical protein [Elusimicrobiota bacterium]